MIEIFEGRKYQASKAGWNVFKLKMSAMVNNNQMQQRPSIPFVSSGYQPINQKSQYHQH